MNALQELRQLADSPDNSGSPLALGSNSEAPAWVAQLSQLVNAVNVNAVAPPPKPSKGTRPPPKTGSGARGRSPGARSKSPKRLIDWGNKCFHCGSDKHSRPECTAFNKMMKDHNGNKKKEDWRPPPGYKSAIAKARDAAKSSSPSGGRAARKPIAALSPVNDEADTASEDEEFSECDFKCTAVRKGQFVPVSRGRRMADAQRLSTKGIDSVTSSNRFDGFGEDQEYDPAVLETLNAWANKVYVKPKKSPTPKQLNEEKIIQKATKFIEGMNYEVDHLWEDETFVLKSNKDVDRIAGLCNPLPTDRKSLAKVAKKLVKKIALEDDEVLMMVDSGSFAHCVDAEEEFPDHTITEPDAKAQSAGNAETACGGILKNLGSIKVSGKVDGQQVSIKFTHMKVKVPILSVRKLVIDQNDVFINRNGGYIHNTVSGKKLNFFEYQGVYYLKMKVDPPPPPSPPSDSRMKTPFAGQGA